MIDAHTHIQDTQFDIDREEVLQRAFDAGVEKMIVVGTDVFESKRAIAVAEQYESLWAAVGIHPNECNRWNSIHDQQGEFLKLEALAQHSKVVAIGEVGLDYYARAGEQITEKQKRIQKEGFLVQVDLARKYTLPLIIHTRPSSSISDDAYADLFDLLCALTNLPRPAVLHCYQGNTEVTGRFLELSNIFFSFSGNVTYPVKKISQKTREDISETVRKIPLERILVETDCPYLAPQNVRGKRNEPAFVHSVVEEIARIQGVDVEQARFQIQQTFENIFL